MAAAPFIEPRDHLYRCALTLSLPTKVSFATIETRTMKLHSALINTPGIAILLLDDKGVRPLMSPLFFSAPLLKVAVQ